MLPYIAIFFLPFIPSHSIIFSIAFGFPHSQSISIVYVFILIFLGANQTWFLGKATVNNLEARKYQLNRN
jgi:uncharacterized membrane protein YfbV (UPF0208 family)